MDWLLTRIALATNRVDNERRRAKDGKGEERGGTSGDRGSRTLAAAQVTTRQHGGL